MRCVLHESGSVPLEVKTVCRSSCLDLPRSFESCGLTKNKDSVFDSALDFCCHVLSLQVVIGGLAAYAHVPCSSQINGVLFRNHGLAQWTFSHMHRGDIIHILGCVTCTMCLWHARHIAFQESCLIYSEVHGTAFTL